MSYLEQHLISGWHMLRKLLRDRGGNTLAMAAAALLPLLGLLGGGVDMGRGYLAQSRLQQACDAGVLAARKRLGTAIPANGTFPAEAAIAGSRFFQLNFPNKAYGSEDRSFNMALNADNGVDGTATVRLPTTLMAVFGYDDMPIRVQCTAQINMSNTDIMMVLDVTGSMASVNPGDSVSRIQALKDTVKAFYTQMSAAVPTTSRLRFGFVPYSSNVNVGGLLNDSWMVKKWSYQSREWITTGKELSTRTYDRNWTYVSGSRGEAVTASTYPATYHPPVNGGPVVVDPNENVTSGGGSGAWYSCDMAAPGNTDSWTDKVISTTTLPFAGPPAGTQTVQVRESLLTGTRYWLELSGSTCLVRKQAFTGYTERFERVTEPVERDIKKWRYKALNRDVSNWRAESNGCIEERDTYEIGDYAAVDLSKAKDLDLDTVPSGGSDAWKWRPMYPWIVYARSKFWNNTGAYTKATQTTLDEYILPASIGLAACPAPARKLGTMTRAQVDTYLATLNPVGQTYHDIGMIWGGRLLSPTGLFKSENADVSTSQPTTRHLIFLTDGETAPYDLAYSSYGLEPLDDRRWNPKSSLTLKETVEKRFSFVCEEVKKKNVTVWIVMFGTDTNPVMEACAGAEHYFVAADADELQDTFSTIAKRMGELRVTR